MVVDQLSKYNTLNINISFFSTRGTHIAESIQFKFFVNQLKTVLVLFINESNH